MSPVAHKPDASGGVACRSVRHAVISRAALVAGSSRQHKQRACGTSVQHLACCSLPDFRVASPFEMWHTSREILKSRNQVRVEVKMCLFSASCSWVQKASFRWTWYLMSAVSVEQITSGTDCFFEGEVSHFRPGGGLTSFNIREWP